MSLGTTEQILVVILAVCLAVFLILSIVVAVLIIKLLKHLKHITQKAESIADRADSVTAFFQQSAGPAAIVKLISNIVHTVRDKKEK